MNYCPECAGKVTLKITEGDERPRFVCGLCQTIFYTNPKMVIGAIPEWDGSILLCRRAIEPARGKWTLPAGYLENGETISECAIRETAEEACAVIADLRPYVLVNLPHINQVYFIFRSQLVENKFQPGIESLEVKLFFPAEIPWTELAFGSIKEVLKLYCEDLRINKFPFQIIDICSHK
jgi:ADP-ribose pyrophosphatase YjhB (NUDIX family)